MTDDGTFNLPSGPDLAHIIRGGTNVRDLAAEYGCHESTIRYRLSKAGYLTNGHEQGTGERMPARPVEYAPSPKLNGGPRCAETDPEAFFPDSHDNPNPAKKVCGRCEVREPCLQYALDNDEEFGIWGGYTASERAAILRRRSA